MTQLRKADIERLLRLLDAELATRYFDESQLAPKTRLALEELLAPRPG